MTANNQTVTKNELSEALFDQVGLNKREAKDMIDAFSTIERSKDGLERSIHFEKNRDCDKDFKIFFSIYNGAVHYAFGGE